AARRVEAAECAPGLDADVLHQVVPVLGVPAVPVRDLQDDAAMLVEQGGETRLQRVVGDERVDGGRVRHGVHAKVIRTGAPVITRDRGFPTGAAPARSTRGPAGAVAPPPPGAGCRPGRPPGPARSARAG